MFNIKSVGIIGAGPSGMASLYELLNTSKQGVSTIGTSSLPTDPAFSKITVYEQNSKVGGIWNTDLERDKLPSLKTFETEKYDTFDVIKGDNFGEGSKNKGSTDGAVNLWNKSPVYPGMYAAVAKKFMRYSYVKYEPDRFVKKGDLFDPLLKHNEIQKTFEVFAEENSLADYIKFNTKVLNLTKDPSTNKWIVTLRKFDPSDPLNADKFEVYEEQHDAVIICSGHFSIPYYPYFKGLSQFIEKNPQVEIIHSKHFRNSADFENKNVLVVGAGVSSLDIAQYIYHKAKNFYMSFNKTAMFPLPWVDEVMNSYKNFGIIEEFLPETKEIKFKDGSILKDIDSIILCTGYHVQVPYYKDFEYTIKEGKESATPNSRIKHLYYNIFKIEDPTLAFVGNIYTGYICKSVEASAAAVAGIWSNYKSLPSKEDQYDWEQKRIEEVDDTSNFLKYSFDDIALKFVDPLVHYFPKGRPYPLEDDVSDKTLLFEGLEASRVLYHKFKDGELTIDNC